MSLKGHYLNTSELALEVASRYYNIFEDLSLLKDLQANSFKVVSSIDNKRAPPHKWVSLGTQSYYDNLVKSNSMV